MSNDVLLEYVKLIIEKKTRQVKLIDGSITEWGSGDHISELERQVQDIQHRKLHSPRGSSTRADYTRAEARIKSELASAKRTADRKNLQEKQKKNLPLEGD
jgi:hypothetical protein